MADFINTAKKVVDVAGLNNYGTRLLMELFDPQPKNQFEILLYPANASLSLTSVIDSIMAKLHIQSISVGFPTFEYEIMNGTMEIKGISKVDEVSITFIEDEMGSVRMYLDKWFEEIATKTIVTTNKADVSYGGQYIFANDQQSSKKNAIIIIQMSNQIPSPAWVKLEGLKLKSMGELTLGHSEQDYMTITATFSVNSTDWMTLGGF